MIDLTSNLVPRLERIVVIALRTKDSVPDIPLEERAR
jgi:hypothetical protein